MSDLQTMREHVEDMMQERVQLFQQIRNLEEEVSRLRQVIVDASPDNEYLLVRQEADRIWDKIHKDNWRLSHE